MMNKIEEQAASLVEKDAIIAELRRQLEKVNNG